MALETKNGRKLNPSQNTIQRKTFKGHLTKLSLCSRTIKSAHLYKAGPNVAFPKAISLIGQLSAGLVAPVRYSSQIVTLQVYTLTRISALACQQNW